MYVSGSIFASNMAEPLLRLISIILLYSHIFQDSKTLTQIQFSEDIMYRYMYNIIVTIINGTHQLTTTSMLYNVKLGNEYTFYRYSKNLEYNKYYTNTL